MTANQSIAVEFKQVMKSFGTKLVLNDVSFHIGQGQALCLLGRSGTGKSVTLKLIMALMSPDSGEVWVDQDNVVGMGEHRLSLVRRKLGYLLLQGFFQASSLLQSVEPISGGLSARQALCKPPKPPCMVASRIPFQARKKRLGRAK